jgi:homoserine acetyltransferase
LRRHSHHCQTPETTTDETFCLDFYGVLLACCVFADRSCQTEPIEHTFGIHNFHTESGVTLPEARIVYGTYGHLNAAGDNAVLLPSHYMADMRGYDWLIGPGKALDPARILRLS